MATNNADNQDYLNNTDGFTLAGGTTKRSLTVTNGNISLLGSGSNNYIFPAASDTLIGRASTDTMTNKTVAGTTNVVNANTFVNPYKFSVYRTASLAAVATTNTKISFDTKEYDTSTNFDATTNFLFTAPVAGYYHFTANIGVSAITPTRLFIMLYKNAAEYKRGNDIASSVQNVSVSADIQLAAADTVAVWYYSSTAGGSFAGRNLTYFSGYLISIN